MQTPLPLTRDIVLVGGGHTHALVLRMWAMRPLPGARLTLVNPTPTAAYSGMLPGHIAGHYPREALEIDLVRLARFANARLVLGHVTGIDPDARLVRVERRPDIAYDVASINVGVTTEMPELPGFSEHGHAAKPLDRFADDWQAFVERAAARDVPPAVAVIGAGVAGAELAMAAAYRLRQQGLDPSVTLVEQGEAPFPGIGKGARRALLDHLGRLGVALRTRATPVAVTATEVRLSDGSAVPTAFTIGTAGARPHPWLASSGLRTEGGYVVVGPDLAVEGTENLFAAGDCAHLAHAPRPKAGVFAVREAPVLLKNLRAAAKGAPLPARYRPQRDYLKLISTGGKGALADKFGLRLDGPWLWRLKDRIDRRFMARFQDLPPMPPPPLPAEVAAGVREELGSGKPLCGGCGAKMPQAPLRAVIAATAAATGDPDILSGPGDDAARISVGGTELVLTTDHLRAFTEDPWLMARIAANHAMGDIWAMSARPRAALVSVILPRMRPELQRRTLTEIMQGAAEVFGPAGACVVGGHTSVGAEMTIGFTLTGVAPDRTTTIDGARPGDALILTKPLGTGVVLAAEMQLAAPGPVVARTLAQMTRPLGVAARVLGPEAHAMTDVTGFGLAGHLMTMLEASDAAARLELDRIPLIDGALPLAEAGIRSTLFPANAAQLSRMTVPNDARADLLFDPQTAGGLLAAVPGDRAESVLAALHDAGEDAALIGTVVTGAPRIDVI